MDEFDFQKAFDVSRETIDALKLYQELLIKWQARINLISPNTIDDIWLRHFADSAQLFSLVGKEPTNWLDIGSGAGFPGLIMALFAKDKGWTTEFTLVESDSRKCVFLNEIRRQLKLNVFVKAERIEKISGQFDVISARALASVEKLLGWAQPLSHSQTKLIFPKGRNLDLELTDALASWHIEYDKHTSQLESDSSILIIKEFTNV